MQYQPQSLYWCHTQVTVHSGILKTDGVRTYHAYFSDNLKHDQVFVKISINKMLENENIVDRKVILIESDNCSSQYKFAQHFHHMQSLSDNYNRIVIRIFGISMHGKGEVDHVGGMAKVAVRTEVAAGQVFLNSDDCVSFLSEKFDSKYSSKNYSFKEIDERELDIERASAKQNKYSTIEGSSKFQAMVFTPYSTTFKSG